MMLAAPIFTGCKSSARWREVGGQIPADAAVYWVPLIALFSGMRLGEIVQLRTSDFKIANGIRYFDITTMEDDELDEAPKSLKNSQSRRAIPIHAELIRLGLPDLVARRKQVNQSRLFPEFDRAEDDWSWSKTFSKFFTRFRRAIGVNRLGVTFHSLRHNVEDALRNADVRKDVRDAVQGHGENGIAAEYGSGYYVETLNEAVQKIKYPGLILPSVGKASQLPQRRQSGITTVTR